MPYLYLNKLNDKKKKEDNLLVKNCANYSLNTLRLQTIINIATIKISSDYCY